VEAQVDCGRGRKSIDMGLGNFLVIGQDIDLASVGKIRKVWILFPTIYFFATTGDLISEIFVAILSAVYNANKPYRALFSCFCGDRLQLESFFPQAF